MHSVHFCRCNLHGACGGKVLRALMVCMILRCNLHGACGGKDVFIFTTFYPFSCNLHGACGGKVVQRHMIAWRWMLQSARSVWRQRLAMLTPLLMQIVAICTERVEAKGAVLHPRHGQRFVAICTERVEAKYECGRDSCDCTVAICTERVEAKKCRFSGVSGKRSCNLHGACGGKVFVIIWVWAWCMLQSARSVWRQRCYLPLTAFQCVELQSARSVWRQRSWAVSVFPPYPLQSARSVWRQSQG